MPSRFHERAARVMVEVVSVVFAVLVALGVDELRQDHAERVQAEAARAAVLTELRSNLSELRQARPSLDSLITLIAEVQDSVKAGRHPPRAPLRMELPDFSDAAWQTARMTQATAHLPLQWLILVSKAYETQALYESIRTDVLRSFGNAAAERSTNGLAGLGGQLAVLQDLGRGLEEKYDTILTSSGAPPPAADSVVAKSRDR